MNSAILQCAVGVRCKDFAMIAVDQITKFTVFIMNDGTEKLTMLSDKLIMGVTGHPGDCVKLSDYIAKNLVLYRIRNGYELSNAAAVHLTRKILAESCRSAKSYEVAMLMAGYDEAEGGKIHYLDGLGTCVEVPYMATGCAGTLALGVLDSIYSPTMEEHEAYELLQLSVQELQKRQFVNLTNFQVKVVNSTGTYNLPVICPQTFMEE